MYLYLIGVYLGIGLGFVISALSVFSNFPPGERKFYIKGKQVYGLKKFAVLVFLFVYLMLGWPHKAITSGFSFYD